MQVDDTSPDIDETTAPPAPTVLEVEPVLSAEEQREARAMQVWRAANQLFSGMRYGISSPRDGWLQTRRQFGDTVTSSRKLRYWRKLKALTDTLGDAELDYVRFLAQQRFEFTAAIFRMNAVASVTLPVTAAVVANQLYPGIVQRFIADSPVSLSIAILILLMLLAVVFGNVFKARELRMALELEAARRRLRRGEISGSTQAPESEFDLDSPIT